MDPTCHQRPIILLRGIQRPVLIKISTSGLKPNHCLCKWVAPVLNTGAAEAADDQGYPPIKHSSRN